jgi:hypothetical protein
VKKLALLFWVLPLALQAGPELWLGGTRPYETVPYKELNAELYSNFSATGLRLEGGLLDCWMLSLSGETRSVSGPGAWSFGSRLRLGEAGEWPADLSAFYDGSLGATLKQSFGLGLEREFWDNEVALNGEAHESGPWTASAAYQTPYLWWTLRAGVDLHYLDQAGPWPLTPQLSFELPGDISLRLGASLDSRTTWLLRLSYEIFPSP